MLKLTKKGDKYWLFEDSEIGLFSPSKFTINLELNEIVIVYENGLKSKRYNVIECEIYDLGELTPFTTSSGDLFMQKLEELNCPCFQKNENIYNIFGGGSWGSITGTLSDQTDLQTALDGKLSNDISDYTTATLPLSDTDKLLVNQGGTFKEVAKSELASTDSFMLYFRTGQKTWVLNTWYQGFSQNGFAISGTATYGTASIPDSSIQLNGSFLMIPSGYIIEEVTFSVQYIGSSLASAYANEIYITRGEPIGGYQSGSQSQTNVEILAQESVTITPVAANSNLKFFKKLTIASHVSKTLSVLQVSMREKNINNGVYDAYLYFKFKKA